MMFKVIRTNKLSGKKDKYNLRWKEIKRICKILNVKSKKIEVILMKRELIDIGFFTYKPIKENEKYNIRYSRGSSEFNREIIKPRLIEVHGSNCYYCNQKLKFNDITIDHLEPCSKKVKHKLRLILNLFDNLCVSCEECNTKKRDSKLPEILLSFNKIKVASKNYPLMNMVARFIEQLFLTKYKPTFK